MNFRRTVSLTALLSFLITIITSIVLYIVPQGRVAYWANWKLMGLTKEQWTAIHTNVGFLFLGALMIHTWHNWKSITLYLKNINKKISMLNREFLAALAVTLVFTLGTYFEIPPMSSITKIGEEIKEKAAVKYGEPPYGHAELSSLESFFEKMNLNNRITLGNLKKAGYSITDTKKTIKEIAEKYSISPQKLYSAMKGAEKNSTRTAGKIAMPENPVPGTGNLTLSGFCTKYSLDIEMIMKSLKDKGINTSEAKTLKNIAGDNSISPTDLYYKIKEISKMK